MAYGAIWIWSLIKNRVRHATKTLDFYHGSEHHRSRARHLHSDSLEWAKGSVIHIDIFDGGRAGDLMRRALRIEYEGALYHVMNRGDRRENIFLGDEDRLLFLKTLEEACGKSRWQENAYCLMSNHFHLVIETPSQMLVAAMAFFI